MSGVQQTAQALGGANQSAVSRMRAVGQGVEEVLRLFLSIPGVDQQKVEQARGLFHQAAQLLITSVPKRG